MNSISDGHSEAISRRTSPARSVRLARVTARVRAGPARLTSGGWGSSSVPPRPCPGYGQAALQPPEPVREGVDRPEGRPCGLGEPERVLDDRARRHEVAAAVLVELRQLLPRARVERDVAQSRLPERARGVPAGEALLPPRQAQSYRLCRRTREPGRERRSI